MTEAKLQAAVTECATVLGWRIYHARPARTSKGWRTPVQYDGRGFPDLVLVRERVIYAELKGDRGKPSDDQEEWLRALNAAGQETHLWAPADWLNNTVIDTLIRRGRP